MSEEKSPELEKEKKDSPKGWNNWNPGSGKEFSGCVYCSGRGKCSMCQGTGKVVGDICTACKGSGKCPECGGTGKAKKNPNNNPYTAPPEEPQSPPKAGGPSGPRGWFKRKKKAIKDNYVQDRMDAREDRKKVRVETSRLMGQILIGLTLLVHVIDGLVYQFSLRAGVVTTRIFMYLVLFIFAHFTFKGNNLAESAKEFLPWAMSAAIFVPLFSALMNFVGAPEAITIQISAIVVGVPILLLYFMYVKGLNYKYEGDNIFGWILFWFTPVGLARIWFFILIVSALIFAFNSLAMNAENLPGAANSGYDVIGGAETLMKNIKDAGQTAIDNIKSIGTGINGSINQFYNNTLGQYYTGQVEENKEKTGVFITQFESLDTQYANRTINIYGLITARSFVDDITLDMKCVAQDTKNSSNTIIGKTEPEQITIYQEDQQGVICTFQNGLPEGNYKINLTADFNFETWAYTTYTFMDRDFVNSIRQGGEDINSKFDISPKPKTIYTNGPVMLGINENLLMPITLSTNLSNTNRIPVGMTIENKQATATTKGTIKNVNTFQLRVPKLFYLEQCTKTASNPVTDPNSQDYDVYTFTNVNPYLTQSYLSVSCNLGINPSNAAQLLGLKGGKAVVSIVGTAKYDYELSKQIALKVNKDPTAI